MDFADPSVNIVAETITMAKLRSDGAYVLNGTAADDSQVDKVEVRLDGGVWQGGARRQRLVVGPGASGPGQPGRGMLAIEAWATDKASRTATAAANVLLDVIPPVIFTSTTSLTSGAIISPSQVINDLSVRLSGSAISGASSVYAGWTDRAHGDAGRADLLQQPRGRLP